MGRTVQVTVIGLGPGRPGLITAESLAAVDAATVRWLRTERHPSAGVVRGARSFDYLYESAGTIEEVYSGIVDALAEAAEEAGQVLYAVPGSPVVAERTVELLRADRRLEANVLPGVSFADLAFLRLGVDPVSRGVRLVDGHRFVEEAAGQAGPFLVAQCDSRQVLSDIKLAIAAVAEVSPEARKAKLTVLHHMSLPDESVFELDWENLDRDLEPDHLTSLWVPALGASFAQQMVRLEELGRTLRARCPWDRQQTHQSLTRYLLEESYEALDAIEALGPDGAGYEHLEEELGDVLFQVVFHSVLAAEQGQFSLADVVSNVHDKLVKRHPHVFGDVEATTPEAVAKNWEQLKAEERAARQKAGAADKAQPRADDGIARNLPALLYAYKIQSKAASSGFDWHDVSGALAKVSEELSELSALTAGAQGAADQDAVEVREELGDLLFAVVNVARHLKLDPEAALRQAVGKFRGRVDAVEALARARGLDMGGLDLASLDELWDEVKRQSRRV